MANWKVEQTQRGLVLTQFEGRRWHRCGPVDDVSERDLVKWVNEHAKPFDALVFIDGRVLVFGADSGARA